MKADLWAAKKLASVLDITRGKGWEDGDVIRLMISEYEQMKKLIESIESDLSRLTDDNYYLTNEILTKIANLGKTND